MLTFMDLTIRRAIFTSIVVLVVASLVMDALVFGAAGRALSAPFLDTGEPPPQWFDHFLR